MRIAVVHNAVSPSDRPDEQDVLVQAEAVCEALEVLGHQAEAVACDLNLERIRRRLGAFSPDMVFNLVESLEGEGRLIHLFPFLLDALGVGYTGAMAESILATSNKINAKQHMAAAGLLTPEWMEPDSARGGRGRTGASVENRTWIIKSVWEHASVGLDEAGIVRGREADEIPAILRMRSTGPGGPFFAEAFIEGREFNLSLLAGPGGPQVLPPAEIVFEGYGEDRPRILGYQAKWDDTSFEFHHTPRQFDFTPDDGNLLQALHDRALACWGVFRLRGYARVDFRVDHSGQPWILEVNANPCLSPDAGFAAALIQAGVPFPEAVRRILEDSLRTSALPGGLPLQGILPLGTGHKLNLPGLREK
jgi:D-alanine-D-alanine ligase